MNAGPSVLRVITLPTTCSGKESNLSLSESPPTRSLAYTFHKTRASIWEVCGKFCPAGDAVESVTFLMRSNCSIEKVVDDQWCFRQVTGKNLWYHSKTFCFETWIVMGRHGLHKLVRLPAKWELCRFYETRNVSGDFFGYWMKPFQ